MVLGKTPRMDSRRSSYCSTATIVLFVGLCLVGIWFMTSTTIVPVDLSNSESSPAVTEEVSQNDKPFNDGSSDVTEVTQKEDTSVTSTKTREESSPANSQSENFDEKTETREESHATESEERKDGSEKTKNQSFDDENGEVEGVEINKDGAVIRDDTVDASQEKVKDQNLNATIFEEEKSLEKKESTIDEKPQSEEDNNSGSEPTEEEKVQGEIVKKVEETESNENEQRIGEQKTEQQNSSEMLPDPAQAELLNETRAQNDSWSTQALESKKEKDAQKTSDVQLADYSWKLCNVNAGPDYIPCLDNVQAIQKLHSTKHYEHRERHCPEEGPICVVAFPEGYKQPIRWPDSRKKIWYSNVPHTKLVDIKGHQNWVKVNGEHITFPGGGTQFVHGALHYIDFLQESLPDIAWGKQTRVALDVGCGVASFGGFLFERDVLTMSFAPKDEHEAQVQFALERGIPAFSAVMGTKRLPFPSRVFDVVHCARCRVPWHIEGGMLLLELNRLLRPGGYFLWSATPVYRTNAEDEGIWKEMSELTKNMCWEMVARKKDAVNQAGVAIYRKPLSNECYEKRIENNPPLCNDSDDPNAAWNVQLQACMHKVPVDPALRGSQWPNQWPKRLEAPPYWLNSSQIGIYGRPAPEDFKADYEHWKRVVSKSYLTGMGINWSNVRNVMDMRSVYGGFAAALRDRNVWVMNVVPIDSADTLPIIYERGLFGIYHDWCESFSTYPRTYDLLHADHLFSKVKKRCKLLSLMAEVDRILRPEGKIIVRDDVETINELEQIARSLHWEIQMTYFKDKEGLLSMQKTIWRPLEVETVM